MGDDIRVLNTIRYKAYEVLGTDDLSIFQNTCKVIVERLSHDPMTPVLIKVLESYAKGKSLYFNDEVIDTREVLKSLSDNGWIAEVFRTQISPIIYDFLMSHIQELIDPISKEVPMVNKRARTSEHSLDNVLKNLHQSANCDDHEDVSEDQLGDDQLDRVDDNDKIFNEYDHDFSDDNDLITDDNEDSYSLVQA